MTPRAAFITAVFGSALLSSVQAANFNISNTTSSGQTLTAQSGTVTSTGLLSVAGSTTAVGFGAGALILINSGTIRQTGDGRALRNNSGAASLTVTNNTGALIQAADADAFQISVANTSITLNNSGRIFSLNASQGGAQAVDWDGIKTGANTLNNYATGIIRANYADGVRMGVSGTLNNQGLIEAVPFLEVDSTTGLDDASSSDGVDVQANSNVRITNSGTIQGRHGITGGETASGFAIFVTNTTGGVIRGLNGSGLNIDGAVASPGGATVVNAGTITGSHNYALYEQGDGDGVDVDGIVTLTNSGTIRGINAQGAGNNSEGVSIGGGTVTNTGLISGENNAPGGAVGNGILVNNSDTGLAAFAATTVTNSGTIRGTTGFGIKMIGNFNDTVTNNAGGTIRGADVLGVIQTGTGNDTVTNRGTITNDNATGLAIALEAGNDILNVEGGSAFITGNISGGTGTNTANFLPGAGNSFSYAGQISNFSTVNIASGTVTLSGQSTYTGTTSVTGGTLVLDGDNRLSSSSSLELDGGALRLTAGSEQTFASLSLLSDATIDLSNTGAIAFLDFGTFADGANLSIVNFNYDAVEALQFLGDFTADGDFAMFLSGLTINGQAAQASFEDGYTRVVPEPSTYALIALALGFLAIMRKRRTA